MSVDNLGRDSTKALRLFEINASLYPTSANAHVALGNFWLARNDSAKALGLFEKAVALRPGHQRAQEFVRMLNGASRSR